MTPEFGKSFKSSLFRLVNKSSAACLNMVQSSITYLIWLFDSFFSKITEICSLVTIRTYYLIVYLQHHACKLYLKRFEHNNNKSAILRTYVLKILDFYLTNNLDFVIWTQSFKNKPIYYSTAITLNFTVLYTM